MEERSIKILVSYKELLLVNEGNSKLYWVLIEFFQDVSPYQEHLETLRQNFKSMMEIQKWLLLNLISLLSKLEIIMILFSWLVMGFMISLIIKMLYILFGKVYNLKKKNTHKTMVIIMFSNMMFINNVVKQ